MPMRMTRAVFALALALAVTLPLTAPPAARSDPATIVAAEARATGAGNTGAGNTGAGDRRAGDTGATDWTISVTLRHGDTGWDDYADGWRIVTDEGAVLATRPLAHPHVTEQPFTRSLSGLDLPAGTPLFIESSTNVTGWSGARHPLALPQD